MKKLSVLEKKDVQNYIAAKNRAQDYLNDSLWMTCASVVLKVSWLQHLLENFVQLYHFQQFH